MTLNVVVVYGSQRNAREGIKAAKFIINELKKRNHVVELVDAKEYNLPILDKMYKEYERGKAPEKLQKIHDLFESADCFVIVTGEYNHSMPPGLTNILDYFQSEYVFKPSAILSYSAGSFGGVRSAVHLRAFLAELGMSSIPTTLPVGKVQEFLEDGSPNDQRYYSRAENFIKELEWYADALKSKRKNDWLPNKN
ncbi:NAD(P)H-dependent oxidoreductase [Candidatus Woesearchaeota archaeon]|nr:NAD(P)H-dependent oxidoreductase [Candidatus Woesearchaeota archaeon]